jgi:peptide/nickel transport system ATP-binding protein
MSNAAPPSVPPAPAEATARPPDPSRHLLEVRGLKMHFPVKGGVLARAIATCKAVDEVSFHVRPGETLGLVGESGCGKSTLGKCIVRLHRPTAGQILFEGTDLAPLRRRPLKPFRRHIQMIFQDPVESLNSRHTVRDILEEPFIIHGIGDESARRRSVADLLQRVGLQPSAADRFPFEFSGGQRQRIGIARALALNPKLIVCDEPVSALDVSIQSQVLNLLLDLQREFGLSYLFIAHNLAVVKHVSDRLAIMYLGQIMEIGDAEEIYRAPKHPYTRALIAAIPQPDPRQRKAKPVLGGDVPSPVDPPVGCPFQGRCPHVQEQCRRERPRLRSVAGPDGREHQIACHFDL